MAGEIRFFSRKNDEFVRLAWRLDWFGTFSYSGSCAICVVLDDMAWPYLVGDWTGSDRFPFPAGESLSRYW